MYHAVQNMLVIDMQETPPQCTQCFDHRVYYTSLQVCALDVFFTDLHWHPCASKGKQGGSEIFAVACSDGKYVKWASSQVQLQNSAVGNVLIIWFLYRLFQAGFQSWQGGEERRGS